VAKGIFILHCGKGNYPSWIKEDSQQETPAPTGYCERSREEREKELM
jgi:hypothetical protein